MEEKQKQKACLVSCLEDVKNLTREQIEAWDGRCLKSDMVPDESCERNSQLSLELGRRVLELLPDVEAGVKELYGLWQKGDADASEGKMLWARGLPKLSRLVFWDHTMQIARKDIEFAKWVHRRYVDSIMPCIDPTWTSRSHSV